MLEPPCHLQDSTLKWCARNLNLLKFLNTWLFVQLLVQCHIKSPSLQSIRLSTSTDNGCAFAPIKASKVEKPSSRGVSSLHRWSLMLLPVLWLMPLRSLHTCICVYSALRGCTTAPSPELGPMTQTDLSASMWLHINIAKRTNK